MRTYNAQVSIFNGKYWLDGSLRGIKASSIHVATRAALESFIIRTRMQHKRMKVKDAIVKIQDLGKAIGEEKV